MLVWSRCGLGRHVWNRLARVRLRGGGRKEPSLQIAYAYRGFRAEHGGTDQILEADDFYFESIKEVLQGDEPEAYVVMEINAVTAAWRMALGHGLCSVGPRKPTGGPGVDTPRTRS